MARKHSFPTVQPLSDECGPIRDVVADVDRVPARAADVEVLADGALRADADGAAVRLDHRAVRDVCSRADRHVSADDGRWGDIGGRVDAGPFALVLYEHEQELLG
ncbi:hypothetical protein GCM10020220_038860 [Nonomuraea rubra]